MKFNNTKNNRGFSKLYWVIGDKLTPYTLSVYYLIKSFDGYDYFDLTIRQIAKRTGMSPGKAHESFKKLKQMGIVKLSKKTGYYEGDEYDICDEDVCQNLDPEYTYNKMRKKLM